MKDAFTVPVTELKAGILVRSGFLSLAIWLGVAGSASGMTTNVVFQNFSFTPSSVTIQVGDTIVWTNAGGLHTVTGDASSDPFCGSNAIPVSCSETFTSPGTFPYHCEFHAFLGMRGTVIVMPATTTPVRIVSVSADPAGLMLTLVGGTPPYAIQQKTSLADANWENVLETTSLTPVLPMTNTAGFFRVIDHFTGTVP